MLNMLRENEGAVQEDLLNCKQVLEQAGKDLTLLDPELGEEELIKSVAAELAKVTARMAENRERQ